MDTGWRWNQRPVPLAGKPAAGLLLPVAEQFEHPQGGSLLPEGLQGVPHLPAVHGDHRFLKFGKDFSSIS